MYVALLFAIWLGSALTGMAQQFENMAPLPPMGWNSWNFFNCQINERVIRETADAMASNGMREAGYQYVVIDDCWQVGRDSLGFIVADPEKFPSGIKALADYVHARGLRFGLYTCAGRTTCQNRPGSRGHEFQDAFTYATWGVDFVKADWCHTNGQQAQESYTLLRDAFYAAGRPMVLSICEWGLSRPWEWAAGVGQLWRTTGDIRENWDIPDAKEGKCWGGGVIINLDMQQGLEQYAGPGHWNDPDMLQVGNGSLTEEESRAHFSLWCMLAAPLFAGNDIRNMPESMRAILLHKGLIGINQDPLGRQGYKVRDYGELELYYKPLSDGRMALCLFNRFDFAVELTLSWEDLTIACTKNREPVSLSLAYENCCHVEKNMQVTDVWNNRKLGLASGNLQVELGRHDVLVMQLEPLK